MNPQNPPPVIPYSPAQENRRTSGVSRLVFSWSLTIYSAGILFVIVAGAIAAKPMSAIFKDFKIKLPALTEAILSFSLFLNNSWLWVLLIPAPFVIGTLGGMFVGGTPDRDDQRMRLRLLRMVLMLLAAGVALTYVLGMFLPLYSLVDGMSGGGKK